jgi:hypothetical protein
VSEIYSPPRVTAELKRKPREHLVPGFALDLAVVDPDDSKPWDFSDCRPQDKAMKMVRTQPPYMVIGSQECKAFCTFMTLNGPRSRNPEAIMKARAKAILHIEFMIRICCEQLGDGRYFLHGHPAYATS